ncbi:ATP-binding cassette domain-containing protein, partial [Candidatus Synechococcus spongiarum]|uniref:ATP-binding cassette domain-containing protein n=1 Tax=Candidatus Synechococcus spongiarum TaxID=431041 RepID=UPI00047069C8
GQELQLGQRRLTEERLGAVLTQVGLTHVSSKQPPERLSGGQQRRLALAVQLLRDPQVLLLDEPTAGLDGSARDSLLELLGQLRTGRVLVVVTHEPGLFAPIEPRCWQLQDGALEPC